MKIKGLMTALILAITVFFDLVSVPVHAENAGSASATTYTITINETGAGHLYSAYQIFAGDVSEKDDNKILSNVTDGSGLKQDTGNNPNKSLVNALRADSQLKNKNGIKDLTASASAADIASAIETANLSAEEQTALAKVLNKYKTDTPTETSVRKTDATGKTVYEICNLPAGYYLVVDGKASDDATGTPSEYSSLILQVAGNVQVDPKTSAPQVIKKVYDPDYQNNDTVSIGGKNIELGEGFNDVTDANIYDDVTFEVISTLPENYDSYDRYYYAIVDDLDPSFYIDSAISGDIDLPANVSGDDEKNVKVDDKNGILADVEHDTYEELNEYTLSYKNSEKDWKDYDGKVTVAVFHPQDDPEKTRIMGIFTDLRQQKDITKDTVFKFSYSAMLDLNAKIGNTVGNQNIAKLSYSNDPQNVTSLAETPKDLNVVFTYELDIQKISSKLNQNDSNVPLANVPFALYQIYNDSKYYLGVREQKDTDNKYLCGGWDEKSGVDPKTDSEIHVGTYWYANYNAWKRVLFGDNQDEYRNWLGISSDEEANEWLASTFPAYSYVLYSDADGNIPIKGLDAGTYYIEELEAPDGYNKLSGPIQITINPEKKNTQDLLNSTDSGATLIESIPGAVTRLSGSASVQKNGTYVEDKTVAEAGPGNASTGILPVTVKNKPGSLLPQTGGTGKRLFYGIGSCLIAGAVILLMMRKKNSSEKEI